MVPLYLPLPVDKDKAISNAPLFFGGINVYLQQKSHLFRKTPHWIDRLFDSPKLLRWVGRKAQMTDARSLAQTTISMLQAEQGRQIKELDRLIGWLSTRDNKPDVVCLSNALLAGLAKPIKAELSVPVVCLLQDEDGFLDGLASPYSEQAWEILARRSKDVDAFIAVSKYYAGIMQQRLELDAERIYVAYVGISLDGCEMPGSGPGVPTIGFLSRMCTQKGLDTLVEAFIIVKKDKRLKNARLRVAGGHSAGDRAFVNRIRQQLSSCGLIKDVDFWLQFDPSAKRAFLRTLSLLSVPEKQPVSYGLYVLEALAAGVPVVQPQSGVFPELLEITGGGLLFEPGDAGALASAMQSLLLDPDYACRIGKKGREAVFEKFDIGQTAKELVRIYEGVVHRFPRG